MTSPKYPAADMLYLMLLRLIGMLWLVFLAAVNLAVWGPFGTPDAITYLWDGWLHAEDIRRGLRVQVIYPHANYPNSISKPSISSYAWSPDGGQLAYWVVSSDSWWAEAELYLRDEHGERSLTGPVPQATEIYWLPGGRELLLMDSGGITIVNTQTGEAGSVLPEGIVDVNARYFIPLDENTIGVRARENPGESPRYYRLNIRDYSVELLAEMPCTNQLPREWAWSPDRQQVIYGCFDAQALFMTTADNLVNGKTFAPLTILGEQRYAQWSPDGRRVAFTHYPTFTKPGEPPNYLYIVDLATGEQIKVDRYVAGRSVRWLPPIRRVNLAR